MEITEYQLLAEYRVTIGDDGTGWILGVGPTQHGETWAIASTQTLVENSVAESRLRVYRNSRSQIVEGTYSGNQDTSNTTFDLQSGELLNYQYINATPGATAIVSLTGIRKVKGRRAY